MSGIVLQYTQIFSLEQGEEFSNFGDESYVSSDPSTI